MVNQPAPSATTAANVTPGASSSSVDFDYSGLPVTVSNEMALDLVKQFGIHNAWLAFLKVRGLSLSGEEAAKSKALRRFRARIKKLKSTVETLRDRSDDVSTFMAKEFDTFLEPNSIELKKGGDGEEGEESEDGEEEGEGLLAIDEDEEGEEAGGIAMPTTSSLLRVISKRVTGGAGTIPAPTIGTSSNNNSNNIAASSKHQPPAQQSSPPLAVDTAKEQVAKRHQETIDDVVSSILDKIHNNVPMEGEQAAAAAATAAAAAASASAAAAAAANAVGGTVHNSVHSPPKGKSAQTKKGGGSKAKKAAANDNSLASGNSIFTYPLLSAPVSAPSRGKGKRGKIADGGGRNSTTTMTVMSSGTVAAYPTPIGISPSVSGGSGFHHYPVVSTSATAQHLPLGTKLLSQGGAHYQQPLSVQPSTTFQLPFGAVPITLAPAAGTPVGQHGNIGSGGGGGAITLPSTVTVQALIQSLQQQHPGQPVKHLQFVQAAPPPHHQSHQQQQLGPSPPLPDSSQDVHQRATAGAGQFTTTITTTSSSFATTSSAAGKRSKKAKGTAASAAANSTPGPVVIKSPYRSAITYSNTPTVLSPSSSSTTTKPSSSEIKSEGGGATAKKTTKRGPTNKGASKGEVEQEAVVGSSGGGQKHAGGKSAEAMGDVKKLREQQEVDRSRIDELEKELSKCQRQLNVERNKNAGQKKKLDKTQAELEKSMDAIQLVQIDLACQKTDNNNLSAENIALRAELQQLRSKGASGTKSLAVASTSTKSAGTSTSKASTSGRGTGAASTSSANNTGGKRKTNNSSQDMPKVGDDTAAALLEPIEYGRRQSKRICVARNRYLYNMF